MAMNKYIFEKCGVDIRKKFLNIKPGKVMNSLPSGAVGTNISTSKLNEFIKRNKLLQPQSTGIGNPNSLQPYIPLFLCT